MSCDLHIVFEGECHESDRKTTPGYTEGDKTPEKRPQEVDNHASIPAFIIAGVSSLAYNAAIS